MRAVSDGAVMPDISTSISTDRFIVCPGKRILYFQHHAFVYALGSLA